MPWKGLSRKIGFPQTETTAFSRGYILMPLRGSFRLIPNSSSSGVLNLGGEFGEQSNHCATENNPDGIHAETKKHRGADDRQSERREIDHGKTAELIGDHNHQGQRRCVDAV